MGKLTKAEILLATAELRSGSIITENEIACLMRRWSHQGDDAGGEIEDFMAHGPYRVSEEQTAKGLAWWQKKCWTPCCKRRDTEFTRQNLTDLTWWILNNFDHFLLLDFELYSSGYRYHPYPVYRVVATSGSSFDYIGKRVWGEDPRVIL